MQIESITNIGNFYQGKKGGKRDKFNITNLPTEQALQNAQLSLSQGDYITTLDILEQLMERHPDQAVNLLCNAYEIYQSLPDKNSRYYLYQARHFNFEIAPGSKVLDIGSGNIPFPFATHLADLAVEDHKYGRAGEPFKYLEGKPVYECNIENLPFADNEFDFVYCSHVMEHVHNPEKACSEVMRVAKRGYIETPIRAKDLFLNTAAVSNHIWKVDFLNDELVFTEYTKEELKGLSCDLLMDMHVNPKTDREKSFSALVLLKSDMLNTMLYWNESFNVRVVRQKNN